VFLWHGFIFRKNALNGWDGDTAWHLGSGGSGFWSGVCAGCLAVVDLNSRFGQQWCDSERQAESDWRSCNRPVGLIFVCGSLAASIGKPGSSLPLGLTET
jgi:hypothetical protein